MCAEPCLQQRLHSRTATCALLPMLRCLPGSGKLTLGFGQSVLSMHLQTKACLSGWLVLKESWGCTHNLTSTPRGPCNFGAAHERCAPQASGKQSAHADLEVSNTIDASTNVQ